MRNMFLGATLVMLLLGCCGFCTGCGKSYAGGSSGGAAIPHSLLMDCSELQYDTYEGAFDASKQRPLFAVLWRGHGGTSTYNQNNLLVEIHGHRVRPALDRKSVYALRPDYTLDRLDLSADEVDHVFELITQNKPRYEDSLWTEKIVPHLSTVEAPNWRAQGGKDASTDQPGMRLVFTEVWVDRFGQAVDVAFAVVAVWTVMRLFREATSQTERKVYLLFWSLAPPVWFSFQYNHLFKPYGAPGAFEFFKYGQDLGLRVWLTMVALTTADLFRAALRESKRKEAASAQGEGSASDSAPPPAGKG